MNACIGWDDGRHCPHWNAPAHGCKYGDRHPGVHRCECGATRGRHSGHRSATHLSFAALEHYVYITYGPDPHVNFANADRLCTDGFMAFHLNVTKDTAYRWRRTGHLGRYAATAQKAAEALGVRVETIWGAEEAA